MTDRLPASVNSEPRGHPFVNTLGMIVGWAKPTGRAKCAPDDKLRVPTISHGARNIGGHGARAPLPTLRSSAVLAGLALLVVGTPASAQGKLDARYEVTLAGIPVGKG